MLNYSFRYSQKEYRTSDYCPCEACHEKTLRHWWSSMLWANIPNILRLRFLRDLLMPPPGSKRISPLTVLIFLLWCCVPSQFIELHVMIMMMMMVVMSFPPRSKWFVFLAALWCRRTLFDFRTQHFYFRIQS